MSNVLYPTLLVEVFCKLTGQLVTRGTMYRKERKNGLILKDILVGRELDWVRPCSPTRGFGLMYATDTPARIRPSHRDLPTRVAL